MINNIQPQNNINKIKKIKSQYKSLNLKSQNYNINKECYTPSFQGKSSALQDKFNSLMVKISNIKWVQKSIDWAAKNENFVTQSLMILFSLCLQIGFINRILKDEKIPKERKNVLTITQVLTFIIPTLGALTIDGTINKGFDEFMEYLNRVNGKNKLTKAAQNGIKMVKTVAIFALMYKILSTIIALPISNKINEKYEMYKKNKENPFNININI